jgi:hypothetical protein
MALTKCPECQQELSTEATACPHCGKPIQAQAVQVVNPPNQSFSVDVELTSKKWKRVKLYSWIGIIVGWMFLGGSEYKLSSAIGGLGFCIMFFSIISLIVGKVGAWYNNKARE